MNPTPGRPNGPRIWGVGALLQAAADLLAARFGLLRVSGEISALSEAASGHRYFSLKDDQTGGAVMRCAMFRRAAVASAVPLRDGIKVEAVGRLAIYGPRGDLQFIVESVHPVGAGSLHEEFLRLKARLAAEGWFDADRKRSLPSHPRRLGVVSSLGAAALQDIITVVQRRAPHIELIVYPCLVQGAEAPATIVRALQWAAQRREVEALILARGGGSLEDLWAFNDEGVVKAAASMPMPVVCGVGHETDVTLADFAADQRAATPTAAAELLTPLRDEELQRLGTLGRRLASGVGRSLDWQAQRLDQLALMVLRPAKVLAGHGQRLQRREAGLGAALRQAVFRAVPSLERRAQRLMSAPTRRLQAEQARLHDLSLRLQAQDPAEVLRRGYAWVTDAQGAPLMGAGAVRPGLQVRAVWHDGAASAIVQGVELGPREPS